MSLQSSQQNKSLIRIIIEPMEKVRAKETQLQMMTLPRRMMEIATQTQFGKNKEP